MEKTIINLYENDEKIIKEKKKIENFLFNHFPEEIKFFKTFKKELYIQLLSSLNIFYIKKDLKNLIKNIKIIIKLYKNIKNIENLISPSLIFYPNYRGLIINNKLIDIFNNHISERIIENTINIEIGKIFISKFNYPKNNIYYFKPDGADDLIGSYSIEFFFKKKLCSRIGFFIGKNSIYISCIQNKQIGRLNYEIKNIIDFPLYLIPLIFLVKIIKKKYIIFPSDEGQVSRIYGDFKKNYDILGVKLGFSKIENGLLWKGNSESLIKYIEKFDIHEI